MQIVFENEKEDFKIYETVYKGSLVYWGNYKNWDCTAHCRSISGVKRSFKAYLKEIEEIKKYEAEKMRKIEEQRKIDDEICKDMRAFYVKKFPMAFQGG